MTFGERVRELRKEQGLTQRQLAAKVGVDFSYLSKMENDRLEHTPSIKAIASLAEALGADELELMGLANKVPAVFEALVQDKEALRFFRQATRTSRSPQQWRDLTAYMERQQEAQNTETK